MSAIRNRRDMNSTSKTRKRIFGLGGGRVEPELPELRVGVTWVCTPTLPLDQELPLGPLAVAVCNGDAIGECADGPKPLWCDDPAFPPRLRTSPSLGVDDAAPRNEREEVPW